MNCEALHRVEHPSNKCDEFWGAFCSCIETLAQPQHNDNEPQTNILFAVVAVNNKMLVITMVCRTASDRENELWKRKAAKHHSIRVPRVCFRREFIAFAPIPSSCSAVIVECSHRNEMCWTASGIQYSSLKIKFENLIALCADVDCELCSCIHLYGLHRDDCRRRRRRFVRSWADYEFAYYFSSRCANRRLWFANRNCRPPTISKRRRDDVITLHTYAAVEQPRTCTHRPMDATDYARHVLCTQRML